jgi:hypothetical protein
MGGAFEHLWRLLYLRWFGGVAGVPLNAVSSLISYTACKYS